MRKSQQNTVPSEFASLYKPILKVKQAITNKNKEVDCADIIEGFTLLHYYTITLLHYYTITLLHYCTFMLIHIGKINNKIDDKILPMRQLVENILENEQFTLLPNQISQLSSFIDKISKELNINNKSVVYVSLYEAYLDSFIYKNFNNHLGMYTLDGFEYIAPETVANLKILHDIHNTHLQNV